MRVYTEFEWTEKHMFQSEKLRTLIQIVRQAFLCRNTRRKDCESRESPEQWRYPVVLPLRNSVVGKGRLLALLAVLHGVRKEDPFSGTGLNFRLFFLPGGDGVLVKNGSSNLLADCFRRGAEEAGHSVEIVDTAHANIHPCTGC